MIPTWLALLCAAAALTFGTLAGYLAASPAAITRQPKTYEGLESDADAEEYAAQIRAIQTPDVARSPLLDPVVVHAAPSMVRGAADTAVVAVDRVAVAQPVQGAGSYQPRHALRIELLQPRTSITEQFTKIVDDTTWTDEQAHQLTEAGAR
jgi:hypothetical protein